MQNQNPLLILNKYFQNGDRTPSWILSEVILIAKITFLQVRFCTHTKFGQEACQTEANCNLTIFKLTADAVLELTLA